MSGTPQDESVQRWVIIVLGFLGSVAAILALVAAYVSTPDRKFAGPNYLDLSGIQADDVWKADNLKYHVEALRLGGVDMKGHKIEIPFSIKAMTQNLEQRPHVWGNRCMAVLVSWYVGEPYATVSFKNRLSAHFPLEVPDTSSLRERAQRDKSTILATDYCSISAAKDVAIGSVTTASGAFMLDWIARHSMEMDVKKWWPKLIENSTVPAGMPIVPQGENDVDKYKPSASLVLPPISVDSQGVRKVHFSSRLIKNGTLDTEFAVKLDFGSINNPIAGLWFRSSSTAKDENLLLIGRAGDFEHAFSSDHRNAFIPVTFDGLEADNVPHSVNVKVSVSQLSDTEVLKASSSDEWLSALFEAHFPESRDVYRLRWIFDHLGDKNGDRVKFVIPEEGANKEKGNGEWELCPAVSSCFGEE